MRHAVIDMPIPRRSSLWERLFFDNRIMFNMSWEDPEMDRRALRVVPERDTVISITSGGCNPLNLLCQRPRRLYCVDGNYAQNALLEIKLAAIETCDFDTFYGIFSARRPWIVSRLYRRRLRGQLSERSREFWDRHVWQLARGVHQCGWMGLFCRILRGFLTATGLPAERREQFLEIASLAEQRRFYERYVAPRLWTRATRWFTQCRPLMFMAGVHDRQFRLVDGRHDMYAYVRERVEYALTRVPVYDNYFLSATLSGRMRGRRVPPYLLAENFDTLRANLDRVTVVTGWLDRFLDALPAGSIDKFNLLDIFDWMDAAAVERTWRSVLRAASPRAIMIHRSGSYRFDPPDFVRARLRDDPRLAAELLAADRSATYGSFYVYSAEPAPGAARPRASCDAHESTAT